MIGWKTVAAVLAAAGLSTSACTRGSSDARDQTTPSSVDESSGALVEGEQARQYIEANSDKIPLPAGASFDGISVDGSSSPSDYFGTMAFYATCKWALAWEQQAGNESTRTEAVDKIRQIAARPDVAAASGEATVSEFRRVADAAAAGDAATVAGFTRPNCS